MDVKQLRKRCEARLESVELPVPFDLRTFCRALARNQNRPIVLRPIATQAGPVGLWVASPAADFIFYEQETSPLHQEHIILHEISHLLCGHHPLPLADAEFVQLLFPDLCSETVQRVLRRTSYSTDEEREAEILASLIRERAVEVPHRDQELAGPISRLATSLDHETGDPR